MIRLAEPGDAAQLFELNERFNGPSGSTVELMARSLGENPQELVVVADMEGTLAGFVCVQVKRSFCYEIPSERAAIESFGSLGELTVLTGGDNLSAQELYNDAGFVREDEVMFLKEPS